uniref:Profilin n=1 Tax=Arion vulgaris TaxID=1028688 RepID=A0A0B7AHN0_9EUPU
MSSWDAYIVNMENSKAKCKYAAIFGKTPVAPWAESKDKDFSVTPAEVGVLHQAITNQDQNILATGLTLGKNKFTCLRLEPDILICQGKGDNKDHSLVIGVTLQAIIVAFNDTADVKTSMLREVVEQLCEYLKANSY